METTPKDALTPLGGASSVTYHALVNPRDGGAGRPVADRGVTDLADEVVFAEAFGSPLRPR
ncbi:hypothetical protein KOI35_30590 [Actinoplanes bogorensis]|uniref:Uncharacterized protein n=1 Tax=Paractinoplanes bogorensis TaxID=1610840 RepID=A0ABS5YWQ2_9ACTN|nr:hypothetical protein [Actinoplanes bogorensis]MBU2667869.1 hypothetical protein [Actinoplanes bogorensis]